MLSPLAMQVALFALVALSVGGIAVAALYPRLTQNQSSRRMETVSARASDRLAAVADDTRRKRNVEDTLKDLERAQKERARRSNKPSLVTRIRQAGLGWSRNTYFLVCLGAALVSFFISITTFGLSLVPSIGFGIVGGLLLPHFYIGFMRKRRFKRFSNEFANAIDVIVRGVKAGLPLVDCLRVIATEAQEPVRSEFQTIVEDQTLGMPLGEAVQRLPERIPLAESNFFAIVIMIQSRTGGSLSEALGNLSKVLRERKKMEGKIRAMSQEAKSSAAIIGALPLVVGVLVYLTSPDYIMLLFVTFVGNVVLAICAFWMFLGVMVMRKMINFDF